MRCREQGRERYRGREREREIETCKSNIKDCKLYLPVCQNAIILQNLILILKLYTFFYQKVTQIIFTYYKLTKLFVLFFY